MAPHPCGECQSLALEESRIAIHPGPPEQIAKRWLDLDRNAEMIPASRDSGEQIGGAVDPIRIHERRINRPQQQIMKRGKINQNTPTNAGVSWKIGGEKSVIHVREA